GHADFAGGGIGGGFSQGSQREHGPELWRNGHNQRADAKGGHGLGGGASSRGVGAAPPPPAGLTKSGGVPRDGQDHQPSKKKAPGADRQNKGNHRACHGAGDVDTAGKPGEHGESRGNGQRFQKSRAGRWKFSVVQEFKDSQDGNGKGERKQVGDPQ